MKRRKHDVLSNILWMTFDKVFILIMNLLVTVKVANYFGVSKYGNYQYAVSVVAILEILVAFVDGRVVKKKYLDSSPNQVVFNATICRIMFSGISAIIGLILILFSNRGKEYALMFSILLMNAIIVNLRFGMANRFEYLLKSKKVVVAADLSLLFSSILQLIAIKFQCTIVTISMITLIASVVNLIIIKIQYRNEFSGESKNRLDKKIIRNMIIESTPLAIAASCATIYSRCDLVMLGAMLTNKEVGIYSIAVKLISVVQIAIVPIRESYYPKLISLYRNDKEAYEKRYIQLTSVMTWIYIVGVLCSFVVLPFAFRFFNKEYIEAFSVYKVYVLGTFFMYNAALRAGHFTMINKGSILMYSQIISVILNVALNYIGIKTIGLYGAALATIITQFVSLFISNIFLGENGKKIFKWQLKAINPLMIRGK